MSSQPQPAQVEKDEEATLAFGVGRLPALLAALGFSLAIWRSATDGNDLFTFLSIFIGFGAVNLGMDLPKQEKEGWYAAGLLTVGVLGSLILSYAVTNLLPDDFARTVPGVLTQQAVTASALYFFFSRMIPVNNTRLQHG